MSGNQNNPLSMGQIEADLFLTIMEDGEEYTTESIAGQSD